MSTWDDIWAMAQEMSPLIAGLTASGNHQKASEMRQEILDMAKGLNPNDIAKLDATLQGDSEFGKIKEDPMLRDSEIEALNRYKDISNSGGMDAVARARLAEARGDASQYERGQREAVSQDFSERGMGGSGAELAASLQAQQSGADREAAGGIRAAGDAEMRALQAIRDGSSIASRVRGEDAQMASQKAAAQDAINRFNTSQRSGVNKYNVDQVNGRFDRQAQRVGLAGKALSNAAEGEDNEAQRKRNYFGTVVSSAAKGFGV